MDQQIDYAELKKGGYIVQRDPNFFTVRLWIPAGMLSSEQLIELGRISRKYGRGEIHITSRQGIQIPYVRYEQLGDITKELNQIGIPPGSCGPRIRNISACVGEPECPYANINVRELVREIQERISHTQDLPAKLKIAVTGCPNSCAKPQLNDIGIMGVVKPRILQDQCNGCGICVRTCREAAIKLVDSVAVIDYDRCVSCGECIRACPIQACLVESRGYNIFIGGNVGRHPRLGYKIAAFADKETVFKVIQNIPKVFSQEGLPNERLGKLIDRIGLGAFLGRILSSSQDPGASSHSGSHSEPW